MTTPASPSGPPGDGLNGAAARGAMRRDILRANTAVAVVLAAVLALALAAVFAGLQAARNQRRAEAAEAENQERLRMALTEEARAIRESAEAGGRIAALNAISNAVAIRISPELRTEAIACLALGDLLPEGPLIPAVTNLSRLLVDSQFRYYADSDREGKIYLRSLLPEAPSLAFDPGQLGIVARQPAPGLDFSPDGSLLAACLANGTILVWNLASRQPVFTNNFPTNSPLAPVPLRGLAFTPDSRRLIFTDPSANGQISIYNLATGRREASGVKTWGRTFRLRADAQYVALAVPTNSQVDILDYPGGTVRRTLALPAPVVTLSWAPDGRRLAVAIADGDIYLWEPATGAEQHFTGHSEAGIRLGFNAEGTLLFSASRDGTTRLWDVVQGRLAASGRGFGCGFSPDGQRIIYWKPWVGFGVWRVATSGVFALHEYDKNEGPFYSLDLSPSGRWCVVTQGRGVCIRDLAANDRETRVAGDISGARVAADEQSLFVCDTNGLHAWPLATNDSGVATFTPANARSFTLPDREGARTVALSGDGHSAIVELHDLRMARIDLTGQLPPTLLQGRWNHSNSKGAASLTGAGRYAVSPDGHWIVTGSDFAGDGPKVWDGRTGGLVTNLPAGVCLVAFSPDGRWLGLAGTSRNLIFSTGDWHLQKVLVREESSLVDGTLAFLPGEPIVALSQTRQVVQLRNWAADQPVGSLIAPGAQSIDSVRVSADGQTLVMGTASDMVEFWRLGKLRRELAALNLDWSARPEPPALLPPPAWNLASVYSMPLLILGGFGLIACVALATLRRHRMAIERFVVAEAEAAQSHRALDLAKVELMHSQKMQALGTLAAGVAHDFNNLLSVIRMSNKLIARQARQDLEIQELAADVEQAVLQGKSVVGSVLGFARRGAAPGQPADARAVIEETVSLLSREFMHGIALTLDLERDLPPAALPRGPLEQLLMNLLVNASEAMQGQGRLKISLRRLPGDGAFPANGTYVLRPRPASPYLELSVLDSGPGIAPEIRGHLFEPFFTTKVSGPRVGTGLGLSLVYSIAEQSGLGLAVESELGRGAAFTVILPAAAPVRETHTVKTANPD